MKAGLERAWLWRILHRLKLLKASMPQWRVVVEARPRLGAPAAAGLVVGMLVWAHDAEEAEALASLAVEAEGFAPMTADATQVAPQWPPTREAQVVARTEYAFYGEDVHEQT